VSAPTPIVLLGAQRFDPTLGECVKALGIDGPIATITAGWQEREAEDTELHEHLGHKTVNLRLHRRTEEVFARDRALRRAHREKQEILRHKQDFYRIRLEHELDATHVIRQRKAPPAILEEELLASIDAIRQLDDYHLAQCTRVHEAWELEHKPLEREAVAQHRRELGLILDKCAALAIAGGQVATILNRLRIFGIAELLKEQVILAWSAGAMAIAERVVLFHDSPPQGPGAAEILDRGLALHRGVVVLPHPETRLRLHDPQRISLLARRFAPSQCVALPQGAHVTWREGALLSPSRALSLSTDGSHAPLSPTGAT
jgi:hypothetical protein